jgi:2-aminoadipate transaminase
MGLKLSQATRGVAPSAVREILKVAEQPDVLSFAGGLPAPELFPVEAIAAAHAAVLEREGRAALQYSTTEGYLPLREWVAADFTARGVPTQADQVLITNGSQQGLDLAARVLLDPGAVVVTENPSYLAALQVFHAARAQVVAVPSDAQGVLPEALAQVLATRDVRLLYLVPNFANPTGATLSLTRRLAVMALAQAHGVPVLEDDPYGALRYHGEPLAPLASLLPELVLSLGTFSKTLAPGLRLGWMRTPRAMRAHLVVAKQASDLHSGTLAQRATVELLRTFDYAAHVEHLRVVYGERCTVMDTTLARELPKGSRWVKPEGGLFFWVTLPEPLDALELLPLAVAQKVAYVPGAPFFVRDAAPNTLRLNFSNRAPADLREGLARLGRLLRVEVAHHAPGRASA